MLVSRRDAFYQAETLLDRAEELSLCLAYIKHESLVSSSTLEKNLDSVRGNMMRFLLIGKIIACWLGNSFQRMPEGSQKEI